MTHMRVMSQVMTTQYNCEVRYRNQYHRRSSFISNHLTRKTWTHNHFFSLLLCETLIPALFMDSLCISSGA